jgi:hypothetical protein
MQKVGCTGWVGLFVLVLIIASLFKDQPWTILVAVALVGWGVWAFFKKVRSNRGEIVDSMQKQANRLEAWAETGPKTEAAFDLATGERLIDVVGGIQLAEYASSGSTYSGGNAGISVPVFGRVRANVGASKGQLTKNPAELKIIDTGQAAFTSKRIIFTGTQQTRVWELDKILNATIGTNGSTLALSVSNRTATSTLIQANLGSLGPGLLYGVAFDAHKTNDAEAIAKARLYAQQLRDGAAKLRAQNQ